MSSVDPYPTPVDTLLTYGVCENFHTWPDYVSELGLGPEHVSDLIRMATDPALNRAPGDSLELWAPVHAWRALGQLRAEEAIKPLMPLFDDLDGEGGDLVLEELPRVYGMIGPAALPELSVYLADSSHGKYPRVAVTDSLEHIGKNHPDARAECAAILTRQLERFEENPETLNAFLISPLMDLKAMESLPVIERAFAADCVDLSVFGDWEDVQIRLGLKPHREKPRPSLFNLDEFRARVPRFDSQTDTERKGRQKAKANRKQAKKSRKANRGKKKK